METVSNYEVMKETAKAVGRIALLPFEVAYTFPTFMRRSNSLELRHVAAFSLLAFPFISGYIGAGIGESINPKFEEIGSRIGFGVNFVTNTASGIYEIYNHVKDERLKKVGQKTIDDLLKS